MQMFSLSHILYLIISASICIAFYFIFRNKSQKTKETAIFVSLILGVIVHFIKILIPEYRNNLPSSLISITAESICAISALSFPFIYKSKNLALKNYMVVVGVISGVATLLIPGDILGKNPLDVDVIRFFTAHTIILLSPLFMYIFNIHRPTGKWVKHTLVVLLIVFVIMILNNLIFTFILEGKDSFIELLKEMGFIRE